MTRPEMPTPEPEHPNNLFAQLETEMGDWGVDTATEAALAGLDRRVSIQKQLRILETVKEHHAKQRDELGTTGRAVEKLSSESIDPSLRLTPALDAGGLRFIVDRSVTDTADKTKYVADSPIIVAHLEETPRGTDYVPSNGFNQEDISLMATQFAQLEQMKHDGVLPDLQPHGTYTIFDPSTALMMKPSHPKP